MPRHLGCRNVSEYRHVVERMNERGEWTSKHYVSQLFKVIHIFT